jgi:hypothetical protein
MRNDLFTSKFSEKFIDIYGIVSDGQGKFNMATMEKE